MADAEPPTGDDAFFRPVGKNGRRRMRPGGAVVLFVIGTGSFAGTAIIGLGFRRALLAGALIALLLVVYGTTRGFRQDWWTDETET